MKVMKTNYKLSGTPNSPVIVLSNSLGARYSMWDDLVPLLLPYFRVLQYDTRGHGASDKPDGPYTIDTLGRDVIDLMDQLKIDKAYYCGLSIGGLIGQWLGIHHGERFYQIALSNTAAKIGERQSWLDRVELLRAQGMQAISDATMGKWFSSRFKEENPKKYHNFREMFLAADVQGYCGCCHALAGADFSADISRVDVPVLVIAGDEDPVTTVMQAQFLVEHIPDAQLLVINGRHLLNAENPQLYAEGLIDFFIGSSRYERGMHVRRCVLGEAHVEQSLRRITSFNKDFQDLVADVPWGRIWSRPGLDKHQRSLITLSMMIALNREKEFKMHVKAALNNGVSTDELKELILQASIYCGFPAALDAFRNAEETVREYLAEESAA